MAMDIVTIDFETYYDKTSSLSKMTTESYVRRPLFEVIGVGIKVNDYPTDWYSREQPRQVPQVSGLQQAGHPVPQHSVRWGHPVVALRHQAKAVAGHSKHGTTTAQHHCGWLSLAKLVRTTGWVRRAMRWWLHWASARLTSLRLTLLSTASTARTMWT
jgi:hypothetical protein